MSNHEEARAERHAKIEAERAAAPEPEVDYFKIESARLAAERAAESNEEPKEEPKQEEAKVEEPKQEEAKVEEAKEEDEGEMEKRQRRLFIELREKKRLLEEQARELEILRGQRQATPDEALQIEARKIAEQQTWLDNFNAKCNEVAEKGKAENKNFTDEITSLWDVIPPSPNARINIPFTEAVIAAGEGNAHKLFSWLAKNPDEAERIASLDPIKQGVELAKRVTKITAPPPPKPVSSMPPPPTPLATPGVGASTVTSKTPKTQAEYSALKRQQEYEARVARLKY